MNWYYIKNSIQCGPHSLDEIRVKLINGEVNRTDLIWREGMSDWKQAYLIQELTSRDSLPIPTLLDKAANMPQKQQHNIPPLNNLNLVPNYLWQSIVVTILCCWPLGIPAIVYATKVDKLRNCGDLEGAISASNTAKMWCLISVGVMGVLVVIYLIVAVVMVAAGHA